MSVIRLRQPRFLGLTRHSGGAVRAPDLLKQSVQALRVRNYFFKQGREPFLLYCPEDLSVFNLEAYAAGHGLCRCLDLLEFQRSSAAARKALYVQPDGIARRQRINRRDLVGIVAVPIQRDVQNDMSGVHVAGIYAR